MIATLLLPNHLKLHQPREKYFYLSIEKKKAKNEYKPDFLFMITEKQPKCNYFKKLIDVIENSELSLNSAE